MIRRDNVLRYLSCTKAGHMEEGLNRICMNQQCLNQGLLCVNCFEQDHRNHNIKPLSTLLQEFDNLRTAQQEEREQNRWKKDLGSMRYRLIDEITVVRRNILLSLDRLQQSVEKYFDRLVQRMENADSERAPAFNYNFALQLDELNQGLSEIANYYTQAMNGKREKIIKECSTSVQKRSRLTLKSLGEAVDGFVRKLEASTALFNQRLTWSDTLKHPDFEVIIDTEVEKVKNSQWHGKVCALSRQAITNNFSWKVRILKQRGWIRLGMISRRLVEGSMFTSRRCIQNGPVMEIFQMFSKPPSQWEISSQPILVSPLLREVIDSDVKEGEFFEFCEGDMIEFTFDMARQELICEKQSKFRCSLKVKPLEDPEDAYHCCVFMGGKGSRVELLE